MKNGTATIFISAILVAALLFEALHPAGFLYPYFAQQETTSPQRRKRLPPIIPAREDWLTGWLYRKNHTIDTPTITIDHNNVSSSAWQAVWAVYPNNDSSISGLGQCFTVTTSMKLTQCSFELQRDTGSPNCIIESVLYKMNDSKTYGTNGVPNYPYTPLGISNDINISGISSAKWHTFTFSGANQYIMQAGYYCIAMYVKSAVLLDASNYFDVGGTATSTHSGNTIGFEESKWWAFSIPKDVLFYVYGTVVDYQLSVTVHYANGTDNGDDVYLSGKCRTDFGDVRITLSDGTTIVAGNNSGWMENKVDSSYAIIWWKHPEDLSSENRTVYVYYGKSDATWTDNGNTTFLQFDDFNNLNAWTIDLYNESQTVTIEDAQAKFTHDVAAFCHIERNMTFDSISVQVKLKRDDSYDESLWGLGLCVYFNLYDYVALKLIELAGSYERWFRVFLDKNETLSTAYFGGHIWINDTYTWVRIRLTATQVSFDHSSDGQTWSNIASYSREVTWDYPTLVIIGHGHEHKVGNAENPDWDNNGTFGELVVTWADEYIVRKFVSPEPTHGVWGSEETY